MAPLPAARDAFDLGFESDDEFAPAPADRAGAAPPPLTAPHSTAEAEADPFADFPPARPGIAEEAFSAFDEAPPAPVHAPSVFATEAAAGDAPVPRISIEAFCVRQETAAMIDAAAGDRRMAKALISAMPGGISAALVRYSSQPTPALVIVESLDPGPVLIADLDRLAQVCDPGTKVLVLGAANDIALYRELIRKGVSEYLTTPLEPVQLIRTISGFYADPAAPFVGRQIAVVGARGGVGASTLAHNLAWSISERLQAATVIVDFDLAFGTAGLNFNQDPLQGIVDALSQPERLDPVLMDRMLARCTDRLSLFAAPATLDQDYDISAEAYEEVSQKIRGAAPYVVMDLPHSWSAWTRRMLLTADDLVVVASPDLASLRNAKNIVDMVRQARPNDAPPRLVINQVGVPGRPEIPVKDFGEALGLIPSLVLPFDAKLFGQAANNGQMLAEVGPKSKVAEGIDHLAQLIGRREPPVVEKPSLFASLLRKK